MSQYPDPVFKAQPRLSEQGLGECLRIQQLYPEYTAEQLVYYAYQNLGAAIYCVEITIDYTQQNP